MKKTNTQKFIICSLFAAMLVVGAFVKIPIPPVPVTLQTLFVLLSGMVAGPRLGMCSVLIYIGLGLIGLPVFAGGVGGPESIMMPTFGYVIGFVPAACAAGVISGKAVNTSFLTAAFVSMGIIYLFGMVYYLLIQKIVIEVYVDFSAFILGFFVLSIPKDIVVCFISAIIARRLKMAK